MPFNHLSQVKKANADAGFHFFDKSTMRFFNCRVMGTVYAGKDLTYFVTSERMDWNRPRRFTVRAIADNGETYTVGQFGEWATRKSALGFAKHCAKREKEGKHVLHPGHQCTEECLPT